MKGEIQVEMCNRQLAIDNFDNMINYESQCEWTKEKVYRNSCVTKVLVDKHIKWRGVFGKIDINAKIPKILSEVLKTFFIDAYSPKWLIENIESSSINFFNEVDQENYEKAIQQINYSDFVAWTNNCVKSPFSFIQNRDAVGVLYVKQIHNKTYITMKSVKAAQCKGYTRSTIINQHFTFAETNGKTTLTSFLLCDPGGQVPSFAYNMALEARNDILVDLKQMIESERKTS
ncbi:Conserved_hypothetical protein [Hexamita inflata]|uniref:START domain-containing protein n=1 Tax=Hexamita inflata TaxID=28002 RepID=A0AA86P548_9EUKA|nr:Conserved hypothetical protein [Hexamita inflata]CAI9932425.1 Conserved hypothetical protein [Hexamita inflata]